jgi:hypothetical protein
MENYTAKLTTYSGYSDSEVGGSILLRNNGNYLPINTTAYLGRHESSKNIDVLSR